MEKDRRGASMEKRGRRIRGAYVQAWVWVDVDEAEYTSRRYAKAAFLRAAKNLYHEEGHIEVDAGAQVNLSWD